MKEEHAKRYGKPEEEWDNPAQVLSVKDEACNPPAVTNVSKS
jgi:hypothetical protein